MGGGGGGRGGEGGEEGEDNKSNDIFPSVGWLRKSEKSSARVLG